MPLLRMVAVQGFSVIMEGFLLMKFNDRSDSFHYNQQLNLNDEWQVCHQSNTIIVMLLGLLEPSIYASGPFSTRVECISQYNNDISFFDIQWNEFLHCFISLVLHPAKVLLQVQRRC